MPERAAFLHAERRSTCTVTGFESLFTTAQIRTVAPTVDDLGPEGPVSPEARFTTAQVRTVPAATADRERARRLPSWQLIVGVVAGVITLLALVASRKDASSSFAPSPIDRGMVVEGLQALSDYVGFEGHFALGADDHTLVMSGSDLCGDDFPQVVPPVVWQHVLDADFETFECSSAGVHTRFAIQR